MREAQIVVHEADQPDVIGDFPDADTLPRPALPAVLELMLTSVRLRARYSAELAQRRTESYS